MQMDFLASSVTVLTSLLSRSPLAVSPGWTPPAAPAFGVPPAGSSLGTKSVPPPLVDTASPSWTGRCTPRDTLGRISEHLGTGAPGPSPPGEQDVGLVLEVEAQKGRVVFLGALLLIAVTARRAGSACSSTQPQHPDWLRAAGGVQARLRRSLPASLGLWLQRGHPRDGVGGGQPSEVSPRRGKAGEVGDLDLSFACPLSGRSTSGLEAGRTVPAWSQQPVSPLICQPGKSCAGGPRGGDDACGARLCPGEGSSMRN